ncbi:SMP-30/gluconolactonase/LRE family protein [Rhodospirillaceae bacterium KN72]|uniref:SMP-30/gluconolactonase/LRE family protein n=2 Tax=Pacificispira spongiicola TaxID=2729598 RepID=A0A7Y0DX53_9PROT|nr:SMP-30/gluconolactonase/LRE family protein [Pacificispira spongiicola]
MDTLWTGGRWTEGPAYFPAGRYLIWSDIPNDRVMRWDEMSGAVATFEQPCRHHNGHTVDTLGRLIACEHRGRCVSRYEIDGTRTVLADSYDGKRLNSPNDVVVKSDGSIWFTDPSYGIDSDYEGDAAPMEQDGRHVYRIGQDGTVSRVIDDMVQPNGLAFSIDEKTLYVADTGQTHFPDCTPKIRRYDVAEDGRMVENGRDFVTCDSGLFDGFRLDTAGNIWSSAGDGVHCYAPDGTLLGKILIDEIVSNLCFGGPKRNRLFICATTSVRAIYVNARGL